MFQLHHEKGILIFGDEPGLDGSDSPPLKGNNLKTIKNGQVNSQFISRTIARHNSYTKQLEFMIDDSHLIRGSLKSQHLVPSESPAVEHFEEKCVVGCHQSTWIWKIANTIALGQDVSGIPDDAV